MKGVDTMRKTIAILALVSAVAAGSADAQSATHHATPAVSRIGASDTPPPQVNDAAQGEKDKTKAKASEDEPLQGVALPDTEKLRVRLHFMAAWVEDPANASLGFEKQGRIGFVIVGLSGKLNDKLRYLVEINPVNETQPLAACGEANYFFPNAFNLVQGAGPKVPCHPDGRMRVDDYRYVALDPVRQQGLIRQAYLEYAGHSFGLRFGRFLLPIGLTWEETGAMTAKDTPHVSRINTEANFGVGLSWKRGTVARVNAAAVLGDGNRFRDYDYFYLIDGSMDSNSALTGLVSGSVYPITQVEVRGAYKFGYTGSKVERLPNFFASKRNDQAIVASVRYTPNGFVTVFGEYAHYTWGLTKTSAAMLGLNEDPVVKPGYYIGATGSYPLGRFRIGGSIVGEELSRDDSLVTLMAGLGMYRAELGNKERETIYRLWLDTPGGVRIGWFLNDHSNPFPQLSGIVAVDGPTAYQNTRSGTQTGFAVHFRLQ